MAVAHVASSTAQTSNNQTATSLAVPVPTGATTGHVIIAWLSHFLPTTADMTVTGPTGWTKVGDVFDSGSTSVKLTVWRRTVASGDDASPAWTWPTGTNAVAVMSAYSGVNTTTPIVTGESSLIAKADSNASRVTDTITTAGSRLIVSATGDRSGSTYTGLTDTQRGAVTIASSTSLVVQDTNGEVVAGSYSKTFTASVATSIATMGILALQAGANQPPTANAGGDKVVAPGTVVTLSGTASDPDGTVASVAWARVSGPASPAITGGTTNTATVTPTVAGRYVYSFTVTDNTGATATDTMNLNVTTSPARPDSDTGQSGTWTFGGGATTAFGALADEVDTTYAQSPGVAGSYREVRVAPLSDGAPTVTVRLSSSAEGVAAPITTELRMGTTVIASWTDSPTSTTSADFTHTLTAAQLAAVTGRTDLRLRFVDA